MKVKDGKEDDGQCVIKKIKDKMDDFNESEIIESFEDALSGLGGGDFDDDNGGFRRRF